MTAEEQKAYTRLWLAGTAGTKLTDDEQTKAREAAARVLKTDAQAQAAATNAYRQHNDQPHDPELVTLWLAAEAAAITAATEGWHRTPDDLVLELNG